MTRYVIKRLLELIPLLFVITFMSFFIMKMAPGDPSDMFFDPTVSRADVEQLKSNLGLDQPLYIQYGSWLTRVLKGDLGYSLKTGKPVIEAISERLIPTLVLSLSSLVCILLITFPVGLLSGYNYQGRFDFWVTVFSFLGMAIPTFWLGLMFILVFSLHLNIFPTGGYLDPYLLSASFWEKAMNIGHHLLLPLLTIVIGGTAGLIRYYRFGIISILKSDYIKAARSRGFSEKRILFKHAFKNSALTIVTILGLSLPGLVSGSYIIEYIFSWPGLGQLGIDAVFSRDYPVLMGSILMSSLLIILSNLLVDILYPLIDPRIECLK